MVVDRRNVKAGKLERRNLPLLLLRAREAVMARFRPLLNEHGVTEQQWRVLRALHENGPLQPRQLCELCTILSPSLAGVLSRMEELGLVTKSPHDSDQRRLTVELTAKSRALVKKMTPGVMANYVALEEAAGTQTVQELYEALDKLLAQLERK